MTSAKVGFAGLGAMGRGIAQLFAQSGIAVRLYDSNPAALGAAVDSVADTLARLVEKGRLTTV